jgi:hypothetical protein
MARKQMKKSTTRVTGRAAPKKTTRARSTSPRSVASKARTMTPKVQAATSRPRAETRPTEGLALGLELDLSPLTVALGDLQNAFRGVGGAKAEELISNALSRMYDYAGDLKTSYEGGSAQARQLYDKAVSLCQKARDEGWEQARRILDRLGVEADLEEDVEE